MMKKIFNKIIMFLNGKDAVAEELNPCQAYVKFKETKDNNDRVCKVYTQRIINNINSAIDNAVSHGEFCTTFVYDEYSKEIKEKDRKYIKDYFTKNGYKVTYKVKMSDTRERTVFKIRWDKWLK